jgi:hypothetical protein
MPKPQGDVGGICTSLQQTHHGRVTDHVRQYRQLAQFRVASRGRRDGKLKLLRDIGPGHRSTVTPQQQRRACFELRVQAQPIPYLRKRTAD